MEELPCFKEALSLIYKVINLGGIALITPSLIKDFNQIMSIETCKQPHSIPILSQWEKNKRFIYEKLLNKNLTISYPISVDVSERQKEFAKKKFLFFFQKYEDVLNQIDSNSLVTNRLQKDTVINNEKFNAGIKVSKILKRVVKSQIDYRRIELGYSNFLQIFKTEGQLCISINPLDYISMSDNSYVWNSCHSFLDGEYKGGTLSLMTDESTIVCYVKGDKDFTLNQVEIPNKKWRVLIHFCKDIPYIIFSLEYPFENKFIMMQLVQKLQKLLKTAYPEMNFMFRKFTSSSIGDLVEEPNEEIDEICFNDLLSIDDDSGAYKNKFIRTLIPTYIRNSSELCKTSIGNLPFCPSCGNHYITSHNSIECDVCNPLEYCCTCAEATHREELINVDGEFYCEICFDNEFTHCEHCGEIIQRGWTPIKHACETELIGEQAI